MCSMCVKITGRSIVGELVKREMYIFRCVSFTIRISFNAIEWKKDLEIYLAFRFDFPFPTIRLKSHFRIFPSRLATDFIQDKKTVKNQKFDKKLHKANRTILRTRDKRKRSRLMIYRFERKRERKKGGEEGSHRSKIISERQKRRKR